MDKSGSQEGEGQRFELGSKKKSVWGVKVDIGLWGVWI
jgi:hypothetical protein